MKSKNNMFITGTRPYIPIFNAVGMLRPKSCPPTSAIIESTETKNNGAAHQVVFSLDAGKLTLHVTTQDLGEAREELEATWSEEPMEIGYNAAYVQDILRTIDGEEISFQLDRPDNAALVAPVEQKGDLKQLCIIMPLRIN